MQTEKCHVPIIRHTRVNRYRRVVTKPDLQTDPETLRKDSLLYCTSRPECPQQRSGYGRPLLNGKHVSCIKIYLN